MNHHPFILVRQVAYLSGFENCTRIHCLSGLVDVRTRPIREVSQFYPSFIRIHKQYVVNPDRVVEIHLTRQQVQAPQTLTLPRKSKSRVIWQVSMLLDTGLSLPVSDRKWNQLKAYLVRRFPVRRFTAKNRDTHRLPVSDLFQ